MIYLTVNLLKKNEQRHQGPIGRKFMFISVVVVVIFLGVIGGGIKLIQYKRMQSDISSRREVWATLEPRLALYTDEKKGLLMNRSALKLFEGWKESQPAFVKLLNDVQQTVPAQIQFTRFSVRSTPALARYAAPTDMPLTFSLMIEGRSQGEQAENYVINLRKDLLACEQIRATFDSLKLASMRQGNEEENIREFKLEGETAGEERR